MTAFLLKTRSGTSYATVAGLKANAIGTIHGTTTVIATGIFTGHAAEQDIRRLAFDPANVSPMELSFETGERWRGSFAVTRMEYAKEIYGERNYKLELKSIGDVEIL